MLNSAGSPDATTKASAPVVVKKYANRRLYNTETSSYITLENLAEMVRAGRDFVVFDAKSGDDITRGVLTQIIVEEESKGRALLPTGFLRQLIGFYGDSMQGLVPRYLENAMTAFGRQQEQMRDTMQKTVGNLFPGMEEVSRQNLAMVERAMSLFAPFYRAAASEEASQAGLHAGAGADEPYAAPDESGQVDALKAEVAALRAQLAQAAMAQAEAEKLASPAPQAGPELS